MANEQAQKAIELLEGVANGEIDSKRALEEWLPFDAETDELIASGWHELTHFDTDEDIRTRDPEYSALQKQTLLRLATEIRQKHGL